MSDFDYVVEFDGHRIVQGDATDISDVSKLCDGRKPVLAICDPPYGINYDPDWDTFSSTNDYLEFTLTWVSNLLEVMDNGSLYIWSTQRDMVCYEVYQALKQVPELTFQRELILENGKITRLKDNWPLNEERCFYYRVRNGYVYHRQYSNEQKKVAYGKAQDKPRLAGSLITRHDIQSVWWNHREAAPGANHSLQKPLDVLERIIRTSSNEGDVVIDFFSHSGSTVLACERTNRTGLTMDIDRKYVDITADRLVQYREAA